jgi:hypothetical protein
MSIFESAPPPPALSQGVNQEIHLSMGHGSHSNDEHEDTALHPGHADIDPGELVPIVVPIASFGATIAIVAIVLYFRFRSQRLKHELVKVYLDKGQEVPPLVLGDAPTRNADLRRGLVLLAAGVSLAIAFAIGGQREAIGFGAIPGLIGLAYLVVWRIEQARNGAEHG